MSDESPPFVELSVSSPNKKTTKFTKEIRAYHCESWRKSGLSMREYSTRAGLTISTLCQWIKKLDNNEPKEVQEKIEKPSPRSGKLMMELILLSGMRIRFANADNISEIIRLIKALESCR